jgi:hypothetical protein
MKTYLFFIVVMALVLWSSLHDHNYIQSCIASAFIILYAWLAYVERMKGR